MQLPLGLLELLRPQAQLWKMRGAVLEQWGLATAMKTSLATACISVVGEMHCTASAGFTGFGV